MNKSKLLTPKKIEMENIENDCPVVEKNDILRCKFNMGDIIMHKEYGKGKICAIETKKRGTQYFTTYEVAFQKNVYKTFKEEELDS